jgi:hypothetical protein
MASNRGVAYIRPGTVEVQFDRLLQAAHAAERD